MLKSGNAENTAPVVIAMGEPPHRLKPDNRNGPMKIRCHYAIAKQLCPVARP
jgi:hypothetical protein